MKLRIYFYVVIIAVCMAHPVHADTWEAITGKETLHGFVSGADVEINLTSGVSAIASYHADGTATIEAWGVTFKRTWEVVGNDQVCYSAFKEINCFSFEQNLDIPGEYRALNVESGEVIPFHITGDTIRKDAAGSKGGLGSPSADEIAAELANPNSNMGTLSTLFNYVAYDGDIPDASEQRGFQGVFQPSLPYALSPTTNLFIRPAIPVIFHQDVPNMSGGFDSEGVDLGDIALDASIFKTYSTGFIFGGGLIGTLPTATNEALGLDQWLLGPEVIGAIIREWGILGALVSHQWDVAGEDAYDTSITAGQYFYAFGLKDGWMITAAPVFSYDHEANSDNAWTVPVGIGMSKTMILNGRPWQFGFELDYYVMSPELFGPAWQIQLSVAPVVALPW